MAHSHAGKGAPDSPLGEVRKETVYGSGARQCLPGPPASRPHRWPWACQPAQAGRSPSLSRISLIRLEGGFTLFLFISRFCGFVAFIRHIREDLGWLPTGILGASALTSRVCGWGPTPTSSLEVRTWPSGTASPADWGHALPAPLTPTAARREWPCRVSENGGSLEPHTSRGWGRGCSLTSGGKQYGQVGTINPHMHSPISLSFGALPFNQRVHVSINHGQPRSAAPASV